MFAYGRLISLQLNGPLHGSFETKTDQYVAMQNKKWM